jgi:hypothetical protein
MKRERESQYPERRPGSAVLHMIDDIGSRPRFGVNDYGPGS